MNSRRWEQRHLHSQGRGEQIPSNTSQLPTWTAVTLIEQEEVRRQRDGSRDFGLNKRTARSDGGESHRQLRKAVRRLLLALKHWHIGWGYDAWAAI